MTVSAKICGINSEAAMDAAVEGGAKFVGLVFYPPSPRYVALDDAAALAARAPSPVTKIGLVVDASDEILREIIRHVPLDMIQCHGTETPARVTEIKRRFGLPVLKAVPVASDLDVAQAGDFEDPADWLLFDAKPPESTPGALPGGNGLAFDWTLIAGHAWSKPWMLSGGLAADNVAEAVKISGARVVDVSSGVEDRPGVKSPGRIADFLAAVRAL